MEAVIMSCLVVFGLNNPKWPKCDKWLTVSFMGISVVSGDDLIKKKKQTQNTHIWDRTKINPELFSSGRKKTKPCSLLKDLYSCTRH